MLDWDSPEKQQRREIQADIERARSERINWLEEERGRERREEKREEADTSYSSTGRFDSTSIGRFGSTRGLIDWDMLDDREKRTLCAKQGCKRDRYGGVFGGPYCQQCADEGFLDSISGRF